MRLPEETAAGAEAGGEFSALAAPLGPWHGDCHRA